VIRSGKLGKVSIEQPAGTARRPGRPAQTAEETSRVREHILAATSTVFGEFGYHGVNVARVIEVAAIARPTFYRYFRNVDEAMQIVLGRIGRSITTMISEAVDSVDGDLPKLVAGIEGYLRWSQQNRSVLQSIYAGSHDPGNPVFGLRPLLLRQLTELINRELITVGRPPLDEWTVDLFLNSMEYACYRLQLEAELSPSAAADARATIFRTALALLGGADDWRLALNTPAATARLFNGR
jgi:TetR/AcrR family transcriptional regulator